MNGKVLKACLKGGNAGSRKVSLGHAAVHFEGTDSGYDYDYAG